MNRSAFSCWLPEDYIAISLASVSERRTGRNLWNILLYPGEPPIPYSRAVEAIEVSYPSLDLGIFGWNFNWLVLFVILSMAFGFAVKRVLGVEI